MFKVKYIISICLLFCLLLSGCSNSKEDTSDVDYADSIGVYEEMLDAPSEDYIIDCLKKVPTVVEVMSESDLASTDDRIACIYFSSDLVDQNEIAGNSVAEKGTACGGSIDIFLTNEQAEKRNDYLSNFDKSLLDSGAHTAVGSIVIRISNKMNQQDQIKLTKDIITVVTSGEVEVKESTDESKLSTTAIEEETNSSETTKHEHNYSDATCITPKTCSSCGKKEGEPKGHNWEDASCVSPKKCSDCGETEGEPNGHDWEDATCMTAKSCSVCGETEGSANGHDYENGYCDSCGSKDPDYVSETLVWIPTKGGKKYHTHSGCSNMEDPIQVTKSEAISQGFDYCKRCH